MDFEETYGVFDLNIDISATPEAKQILHQQQTAESVCPSLLQSVSFSS